MNKSGKGSTVVIVILVILFLAASGAAAFFGYKLYIEKPEQQIETNVNDTNNNDKCEDVIPGNGEVLTDGESTTVPEGVARPSFDNNKVINQNKEEVSYYSANLSAGVYGMNGQLVIAGRKVTFVDYKSDKYDFEVPEKAIDAIKTVLGQGGVSGIFVLGESGKVYARIVGSAEEENTKLVEIQGLDNIVGIYAGSSTNYLGAIRSTALAVDKFGNAYDMYTAYVNTPKDVEPNSTQQPQ